MYYYYYYHVRFRCWCCCWCCCCKNLSFPFILKIWLFLLLLFFQKKKIEILIFEKFHQKLSFSPLLLLLLKLFVQKKLKRLHKNLYPSLRPSGVVVLERPGTPRSLRGRRDAREDLFGVGRCSRSSSRGFEDLVFSYEDDDDDSLTV